MRAVALSLRHRGLFPPLLLCNTLHSAALRLSFDRAPEKIANLQEELDFLKLNAF